MDNDEGSQPTPAATPSEEQSTASGAAAAHLLEMTARDADRWLSDAQREAASLLDQAREEAARIVRSAEDEAERVRAEAAELQRLATENRQFLRRHLTELLEQIEDAGPAAPEG